MIDSAERMIGRVEEAAAVCLLLAIAALVNLQIVARYVFDSPFIWPEEITKILLIWLCYVAAGAVTRRSAHIAVDTFALILPRVLRLAVMILLTSSPSPCSATPSRAFQKSGANSSHAHNEQKVGPGRISQSATLNWQSSLAESPAGVAS